MALITGQEKLNQSFCQEDALANPAEWTQRVSDEQAKVLLAQILSALGGSADTTTSVTRVAVAVANVEFSFPLPANTKEFRISSPDTVVTRLAFTANGTTLNEYRTIEAGEEYINNQFYQSQTLYLNCNRANVVLEIEVHT